MVIPKCTQIKNGAQIVLTYIDERTEEKVRALAATLPHHPLILPCDVTQEDQVDTVFAKIKHEFGTLDGLIHAIATVNFAPDGAGPAA